MARATHKTWAAAAAVLLAATARDGFAAPIAEISATASAAGDQSAAVPSIISFGDVALGGALSRRIRIENTGDQNLIVGSISTGTGFTLVSSSPSDPIEPGESTVVIVAFEPVAEGTAVGAFLVAHNGGPGSDQSLILTGVGVDAEQSGIGVSAGSTDVFPENTVSLGSTTVDEPEDYSITIVNTGTATLDLGEVISSNDALVVDEQPDSSVLPGDSTQIHLISTAAESIEGTSTISFSTNVPGLKGFSFTAAFVVEPQVPTIEVTTDAGVLASGGTVVGETTNQGEDGEIEIEIENIGTDVLNIESVELSTGFTTDFATTTLNASESDTIRIAVDAATPGLKTGTIVITTDSSVDSVFTANLENLVIPEDTAQLVVTSESEEYEDGDRIELPERPVGVEAEVVLTLENIGSVPLEFTSISASQGFTSSLTSLTLDPAETAELTISSTPNRAGKLRGQIVLSGPVARNTFRLEARSFAAGAALQVVQDSKFLSLQEAGEFPPVNQGSSVDTTVELVNLGTGPIQLGGITTASDGVSGSGFDALIGVGETATATVTYQPGEGRPPKFVTLSFGTDNKLQPTVTFKMEVDVRLAAPEIVVLDDGFVDVANNSEFSFGSTTIGDPISNTFTIYNAGIGELSIKKLKAPKGYRVTLAPDAALAPSESTTFTIELLATRAGSANGKVSLSTNDRDEKKFSFEVQSTVAASLGRPVGTPTDYVDAGFLSRVLSRYGASGDEIEEDINADGVVDISDILGVLRGE